MWEIFSELDLAVLRSANGILGSHESLSKAIVHVRESHLFKGVVPVAILWGLWFIHPVGEPKRDVTRARLASAMLVACVAIGIGRAAAVLLPFRLRPIYDDSLGLKVLVDPFPGEDFSEWSSLPSDHAVLFFALAMGIFVANRTWGIVALMHALFIVSLPRIFTGYHYPSDVMVGALVGIATAALLHFPGTVLLQRGGVLYLERARPSWFYPAMFVVTFQIATMFDSLRLFVRAVTKVLL
jgi:undecaprenyl-diphosphatase